MVYESSYESGQKPFVPDSTRGSWAAPGDFIFSCMGFAFKMEIFAIMWAYFSELGIVAAIPYLLCMALYVVPIVVIHSFLGQFSSSGFISAFRIAPILKGMGYISLIINITILTYYSVFATVPLLFFLHSLRPTLPWSCEGLTDWSDNITAAHDHLCNITIVTPDTHIGNESDYDEFSYHYVMYHIPAALYFKSHFGPLTLDDESTTNEFYFSWQLLCCTVLTWCIIAVVFYKYFQTEKFGTLLRYSVLSVIALLFITIVRFLFVPTAMNSLARFFLPHVSAIESGVPHVSLYVLTAFGSGFGTTITLASFNKFRTNIMRCSWIICFGQMIIFLCFGLLYSLIENVLDEKVASGDYYVLHEWTLYLSSASAIAEMAWANLWSLIYYGMMTIGALIVLCTQLHSILTSIFDEFDTLRSHKTQVTFALIGAVCACSIYFTSKDCMSIELLTIDSIIAQLSLNLLLLLVVLWIYGRERFQRDIEFMLGQPFATWKVIVLRFVAPPLLVFLMLGLFLVNFFHHIYGSGVITFISILFMLLPWTFIPIYIIFIMLQTSGTLRMRFSRCCRPTDWYPVEADDRQRYEEAMGNMDITHQLHEVTEEIA